ncbi:MAG: hypothetical protein ACREH9_01675, partial [Pseudomonadota bacterium]
VAVTRRQLAKDVRTPGNSESRCTTLPCNSKIFHPSLRRFAPTGSDAPPSSTTAPMAEPAAPRAAGAVQALEEGRRLPRLRAGARQSDGYEHSLNVNGHKTVDDNLAHAMLLENRVAIMPLCIPVMPSVIE